MLPQPPGQDKAGGPGLLADLEVAEGDPEFLGKAAQGAFGGEVAAAALPEVGGVPALTAPGQGDGDAFVDSKVRD